MKDKTDKQCPKCKRVLTVSKSESESEFGKDLQTKDGFHSHCKQCRSATSIKRSKQLLTLWVSYLNLHYGQNPQCQICGRKLVWPRAGHGPNGNSVCFDHRLGGTEKIASGPGSWLRGHSCNKENIELFESCTFGILCANCNKFLPTKGRTKWLKAALIYAQKQE